MVLIPVDRINSVKICAAITQQFYECTKCGFAWAAWAPCDKLSNIDWHDIGMIIFDSVKEKYEPPQH